MITSPTQGSPSTFLLEVSHWPLFHLVFNIVFNLKLSQVCLLRKTLSYVLLFSLCSTHFSTQKNFLSDQVIYSVNVNSRHRHLRSSTAFLLCNYWVTDVCIGSTYLLDIEIHLSFFESFNLANTFYDLFCHIYMSAISHCLNIKFICNLLQILICKYIST